jgi:hypothetical protein
MEKKTPLTVGFVGRRDPLQDDRKAMEFLLAGGRKGRGQARDIVRKQMERDHLVSRQIVFAAEK